MSASKGKTLPRKVTIKKHCYALDWYQIEDVEIELVLNQYFVFEYRFDGCWYLAQYDHNGTEYVRKHWGREDFRIHCPAAALVALGDQGSGFKSISTKMGFEKALFELLSRAKEAGE